MKQPHPPPSEKVGLGWTVIDLKTGKARSLISFEDWANAEPWLYTWMEIQWKRNEASMTWVLDWEKTRTYIVDVQTHVRRELKAVEEMNDES